MDSKKEFARLCVDILGIISAGSAVLFLFAGIWVGDMKNLILSGILFATVASILFFRHKDKLAVQARHYSKRFKRIKRVVDRHDLPDLIFQNDFCILETRNRDGTFETLIYVRDMNDFYYLMSKPPSAWHIKDPLQLIISVENCRFSKVAEKICKLQGQRYELV